MENTKKNTKDIKKSTLTKEADKQLISQKVSKYFKEYKMVLRNLSK